MSGADPMDRNIDVAVARAFLTVVESGSVTFAARQLNLTQGAISQQLRRLEALADHALFIRAGRQIVPTHEGMRLVPAVKQFLVGLGVPEPSIKVVTIGQEGALCDDPSAECQQLNRRVHLEIRKLTRTSAEPVRPALMVGDTLDTLAGSRQQP